MSNKYVKKIRTAGDPILRQVCEPVTSQDNLAFLDTLDKVCRKVKNAVGLAAPQIGVAKRAFMLFCRDSRGTVQGRIMINPVFTDKSVETDVEGEGCLSYPNTPWKPIRRHLWVDVEYLDRAFIPRKQRLTGYAARVAQHEMDHLDGVCKVGDDSYPADVEPSDEPHTRSGERENVSPRPRRPRPEASVIMAMALMSMPYGR